MNRMLLTVAALLLMLCACVPGCGVQAAATAAAAILPDGLGALI